MSILYTSFSDDFDGLKAFFNAQSNAMPFKSLRGKTIEIRDVAILEEDIVDTSSGELESRKTVILVDKTGQAYGTTSVTVSSQVQRLIDVLGDVRSWPESVKVKVNTAKSGKDREYTTLELA
jgi:single strand DNA binding protein|uniref:Single stranded DNA binding protein n=1 Tax=Podoviridae sp. cttot15 TaxID=2827751 RepID=A0A8S5TM21_9CAUD|nr:MAG TPA: Single stranded DNA binding protein [Podoviridae sp. cttot15]